MTYTPYLSIVDLPAFEPITIAEAKDFLRLDSNNEDGQIAMLIKAARESAEEYLGKSLITQTLQLEFDNFAPSCVNLLRGPVQSVTSVKIISADNSEAVISANVYRLTAGNKQLVFDAAPMGQIIKINYVAGYGDADAVPSPIKQGILQHVAVIYENRTLQELPANIRQLYLPYRIFRV